MTSLYHSFFSFFFGKDLFLAGQAIIFLFLPLLIFFGNKWFSLKEYSKKEIWDMTVKLLNKSKIDLNGENVNNSSKVNKQKKFEKKLVFQPIGSSKKGR